MSSRPCAHHALCQPPPFPLAPPQAVYGGACVTLTYKLRHSSPQAAASNKRAAATGAEGSHVRELCTAMEAALSDSVFMPGGGILGVPCFHMFNNEVFPAGGNNNMPLTLKHVGARPPTWHVGYDGGSMPALKSYSSLRLPLARLAS